MLPGKRTPWESRKQSQPVRSGPQPLLNTVTTTAILRPVIRTVMTIYKAHTKANTMVGPKIKVLISHWECPQVLCPRRILGFHIHECTSRSPKSKTHFKKREAHANKNVFASELLSGSTGLRKTVEPAAATLPTRLRKCSFAVPTRFPLCSV